MTLAHLIALYRSQSLDLVQGNGETDVLCNDELLAIYANEAQEEACRRSELLRDSSSAMCVVSIAAGAEYHRPCLDPGLSQQSGEQQVNALHISLFIFEHLTDALVTEYPCLVFIKISFANSRFSIASLILFCLTYTLANK